MWYTVFPCLVSYSFYAIPIYVPFLIYEIFHLLVIIIVGADNDQ